MNGSDFDSSTFRKFMGQFPTGIVIVSTFYDGRPVGLAAQSFVSLSVEPPLVSFASMHSSRTAHIIKQTRHFGISILSEHQEQISRVFGSKAHDKFAEVEWTRSPHNNPVFHDSLMWCDAELTNVVPAGDHDIMMGKIIHLGEINDHKPLVFFRGGYLTTQHPQEPMVVDSAVEPGHQEILKD